eukprot:15434868-Alexandrium_andersonii.AAC.1
MQQLQDRAAPQGEQPHVKHVLCSFKLCCVLSKIQAVSSHLSYQRLQELLAVSSSFDRFPAMSTQFRAFSSTSFSICKSSSFPKRCLATWSNSKQAQDVVSALLVRLVRAASRGVRGSFAQFRAV